MAFPQQNSQQSNNNQRPNSSTNHSSSSSNSDGNNSSTNGNKRESKASSSTGGSANTACETVKAAATTAAQTSPYTPVVKPSSKKKRHQRKHHQPSDNKPAATPGGGGNATTTSSLVFPPLPFPPELAAQYLSSAAAAAAAASGTSSNKSRMFGPSPPPSSSDDNPKPNPSIDLAALARSGGINLSDLGLDITGTGATISGSGSFAASLNPSASPNQETPSSCSEAEMKALLSMFVEFMGMFSQEDATSGGANGRSFKETAEHLYNSSRDGTSSEGGEGGKFSRENFLKMNATAAALSAAGGVGVGGSVGGSKDRGAAAAAAGSAFPVFSMLFGAASAASAETGGAASGGKGAEKVRAPQSHPSDAQEQQQWGDYYEEDDDHSRELSGSEEEEGDDDMRELLREEDEEEDRNSGSSSEEAEWDDVPPLEDTEGIIVDGDTDRLTQWSTKFGADFIHQGRVTSDGTSTRFNIGKVGVEIPNSASIRISRKRTGAPQDRNTISITATTTKAHNIHNTNAFDHGKIKSPVRNLNAGKNGSSTTMSINWDTIKEHTTDLSKLDFDRNHAQSSSTPNIPKNTKQQPTAQPTTPPSQPVSQTTHQETELSKSLKAAKKREKKNRRKEKQRQIASERAAANLRKKREAKITAWRSRVVTACSNGDVARVEALLGDCPHAKSLKKKKSERDEDEEEGDIAAELEWLLPACVPKSPDISSEEREARRLVSLHVMSMSFSVLFRPARNGRNVLHVSCQLADIEIVRAVVETGSNEKNLGEESIDGGGLEEYLNLLCEDAGWTALHYAVGSGCMEVVEILLEGGCDVRQGTDPALTRVCGKVRGITPRELGETLRSGTHHQSVICYGKAMEEAIEYNNTHNPTVMFQNNLDSVIQRLADIEQNGYSPPSSNNSIHHLCQDGSDVSISNQPKNDPVHSSDDFFDKQASKMISQAMTEDISSKSKKKRKKKKKGDTVPPAPQSNQQNPTQTNQHPQTPSNFETGTNTNYTSNEIYNKEPPADPLVTALLAMGFTADKISLAMHACGGTDRATADELVMWILESTAEPDGAPSDDAASNSNSNCRTPDRGAAVRDRSFSVNTQSSQNSDFSSEVATAAFSKNVFQLKQQQQQRLAAQAQQKESKKASREKEATAAAQRLAEKRAEQRRINREWNNREQVRQRDEDKMKLEREEERRRKMEQDKVRQEVMRLAKEREKALAPFVPGSVMVGNPGVVVPGNFPLNAHHHVMGGYAGTNVAPLGGAAGSYHVTNSPDTERIVLQPPPQINHMPTTPQSQNNLPNAAFQNQPAGISTYVPQQEYPHHPNVLQQQQHVSGVVPVPYYVDDAGNQVDSYGNTYTPSASNPGAGNTNTGTADLPTVTPTASQGRKSNHSKQQQKTSPKHLEVNAFEFPELGKNKAEKPPQKHSKNHRSKNNNNNTHHSGSNNTADESTVSSGGSARQQHPKSNKSRSRKQQHKNSAQSSNKVNNKQDNASSHSSSPPPGFKMTNSSTPVSNRNASKKNPSQKFIPPATIDPMSENDEEPNQLGEIRATAKVFIPTNFMPMAAVPPPPPTHKNHHPPTPPPGLDPSFSGNSANRNKVATTSPLLPPSQVSNPQGGFAAFPTGIHSTADTATAALLAPVNSLLAPIPLSNLNNSHHKDHVSSLLASVSSTLLSSHPSHITRMDSVHTPVSSSIPHSPVPSSASSVLGMEESQSSSAVPSHSNFLGSLGGSASSGGSINSGTPVVAPQGGIDRNGYIWGSAGGVSGSTGLGGLSAFSFRDNTVGIAGGGNATNSGAAVSHGGSMENIGNASGSTLSGLDGSSSQVNNGVVGEANAFSVGTWSSSNMLGGGGSIW